MSNIPKLDPREEHFRIPGPHAGLIPTDESVDSKGLGIAP